MSNTDTGKRDSITLSVDAVQELVDEIKRLRAHSPAVQALESQPPDLHAVICQAVGLMNQGETYKAHTVLREALIKYADAPVESLSKSKAQEE